VVPAGGAGTRLWPLSRRDDPKFLHDLTGSGASLLQQTRARLAPLAEDRVVVVTGVAHTDAVRGQLPDAVAARVVAEPSPRDSMAAIGLAAAMIEREDPDAVMGSFAADHVVVDDAAFADCVRRAVAVAGDDLLVTLGVRPTYAATGFGWIHLGEELEGHPGAHAVAQFVEKPDADRAAGYLAGGAHRWNAGMFVARPTVLLDLLAASDPAFAADLRAIAVDPSLLEDVWPRLPRIAIDHAVAEPAADAGRVAVVEADFDWEDVGDFAALAGLLPATASGPRVLGDADLVHAVGADGLVVPAAGRPVAVVGLEGVVVVDTGDALLVTTVDAAQDVKRLVAELGARRPDLL